MFQLAISKHVLYLDRAHVLKLMNQLLQVRVLDMQEVSLRCFMLRPDNKARFEGRTILGVEHSVNGIVYLVSDARARAPTPTTLLSLAKQRVVALNAMDEVKLDKIRKRMLLTQDDMMGRAENFKVLQIRDPDKKGRRSYVSIYGRAVAVRGNWHS